MIEGRHTASKTQARWVVYRWTHIHRNTRTESGDRILGKPELSECVEVARFETKSLALAEARRLTEETLPLRNVPGSIVSTGWPSFTPKDFWPTPTNALRGRDVLDPYAHQPTHVQELMAEQAQPILFPVVEVEG